MVVVEVARVTVAEAVEAMAVVGVAEVGKEAAVEVEQVMGG